ncbi:MAG: DUF499 domain-containing protein [Propionibacteriaceae bacterium]|nr:DUF499 domain-containing protein [Propionibacteriaceae bacterium]
MALSNRDRVSRGFELLAEGLEAPVDEVMTGAFAGRSDWNEVWASRDGRGQSISKTDPQAQLRAITEFGREFGSILSRPQQAYASELRETRNQFAHNAPFSSDDTIRALDTIERLLLAVNAPDSAEDVRKSRLEVQASVAAEQTRTEVRKTARAAASVPGTSGLRPWREVVRPHDDVAKGRFTASEFAADLWAVSTGHSTEPEYSDPREFFARTFLTEGLRDLLNRALRRVADDGSTSPVVNLQTNFGGGKTHSMLALWHLFGETPITALPQEVQELVAAAGVTNLRDTPVKRVAIVGNRLKAGSESTEDGRPGIRTIWGELAWQLGGREAYDIVAADDQAGTNPGHALQTLLERFSPALILIDEWVAYARDLVGKEGLPGGSFDTQFTFAQTLTETVAAVPGTMLVVSIPASDSGESERGNDIEIGGTNGQLALERLQNVIRRVADQWRPSSKNEAFEIVRRRLFQDPDAGARAAIAATAKGFVGIYRADPTLFPRDVSAPDQGYEARIRASYPLHPELLDRLYEDWSTLERFQRTRGVLKLVSSIVHELWDQGDTSPLILPGNVPLASTSVNTDLTQYLEDSWKPIIDSDIDGPDATASVIDNARASLGARHVTRRIARCVFMGAAPKSKSAHKGMDKQLVWLGTAIPGDTLGNFGAALDAMEQQSTFFYGDTGHYWFDTHPSVTKTASDYAEQLRADPEWVWNEIVARLQPEAKTRGEFDRVHVAPESSGDIPDLEEARLVIVHPRWAWHKTDTETSKTGVWVRAAIESKGSAQRVYRNQVVFLIADQQAIESLEAATRTYLGWVKVQQLAETMNLDKQQQKQTDDSVKRFGQAVADRLRDTYQWVAYPVQNDPTAPFTVQVDRVATNTKSMAQAVSDRLVRDEALVPLLGPQYLGPELNGALKSAWHDGRISVGEVWGYFTRFPYLPRLARREVLDDAVRQSTLAVMVGDERFALATGWDADADRFRGLVIPPQSGVNLPVTDATLFVDWNLAQHQVEVEYTPEAVTPPAAAHEPEPVMPRPVVTSGVDHPVPDVPSGPEPMVRFFGQVGLNPERYSRDIGQITREVIDRLAGTGADLDIIIDIQARKPEGFTEAEVRTISENARTLKFGDSGFATE